MYNAIYRQYRPSDFDNVVGQERVVTILKNQLKNDQVGHAYIFTGSRGTGKTTVAKIFAKAVNCEHLKGYSPCNKCQTCTDESLMSVVEFDAASNNSVDQIKEIISKVHLVPTKGKYRVYIIDEVHMLSKSAFNALLKTLEEPPKHVIFILATTEIHQIPATILSRCMRLDFSLVPKDVIAERIRYILKDLKVKFEDEAIELLAELGQGSVRDALSVTDTCLSYLDNNLTYEGVLKCVGASNPNEIISIVNNILSNKTGDALMELNKLISVGKNPNLLAKDISEVFRNCIFMKTSPAANQYLKLPKSIADKIVEMSKPYTIKHLNLCMDVFTDLEGKMRYSTQQKMLLESKIVLCSSPLQELEAMVQKKNIEDKIVGNKLSEATLFEYLQKLDPVILGLYMSFNVVIDDVYVNLITEDDVDIREFSKLGGITLIENILKEHNIVRQVRCQLRTKKVNKTQDYLYELFGKTLTVNKEE